MDKNTIELLGLGSTMLSCDENWLKSKIHSLSAMLSNESALKAQEAAAEKNNAIKCINPTATAGFTASEILYDRRILEGMEIVVIPVSGLIMLESSWIERYGYGTATKTIERLLEVLENTESVKAIIFSLTSGGGTAFGNQRLSKAIESSKKITILHYDLVASAALACFKSCNYIFANETTSQIGSYGTMAAMVYRTDKGYELEGLKKIEVYAPQSSKKNEESREAMQGNFEPLQLHLKKLTDAMIEDMEAQRPQLKTDEWKDGRLFTAKEAVSIQLTDAIYSLTEVITFTKSLLPSEKTGFNSFARAASKY